MDFQHEMLLDPSASAQKLVNIQTTFLQHLENAILKFRERLRKLFEAVLEALEKGGDTVSLKMSTLKVDSLTRSDEDQENY